MLRSGRASITIWNRIEPSARTNDIVPPLAARIRDPLWFPAKQWLLGEFHGEDGGSPAWIEIDTTTDRLSDRVAGTQLVPLDPSAPLETLLGEPRALDLATRVELGQLFERMLAAAGLGGAALITLLRATYPFASATDAEIASGDDNVLRFRSVMAHRAIDGGALYERVRTNLDPLPASVLNSATRSQLIAVARDYVTAVHDLLGDDAASPPAWNPERLEYELDLVIRTTGAHFTAHPSAAAEVSWETLSADKPPVSAPPTEPSKHDVMTVLPANVRFRGAPNPRWWDFDPPSVDFGGIDVERGDVGTLIASDALLQLGNDWYVIPIEQPVGTVMHIDNVLVRDVFDTLTLVPRAGDARGAWPVFTVSGNFAGADQLLAQTAGPFVQYAGRPIEEIRFVRDEMLNMVWAIEETIEGGAGQPLRVAGRRPAAQLPPGSTSLVYRLHTDVPEGVIPFVPVARAGAVMAERVAIAEPEGQILRPPLPSGAPYRIVEEELRRSGVRVTRIAARCRGLRGETYLWITRRKDIAARQDSPAPRFDPLLTRDLVTATPVASASLIQSKAGTKGNFELVAALGGGFAHFWRDNDDPARAWHGPIPFGTGGGEAGAVSLIASSFGNLEIVARIGDRLAHFFRDPATQQWSDPDFFGAGVSGTPSFIQRRDGTPGNFEVIAPLAAGGLAHFWRDNQTLVWSPPDVFAADAGEIAGVSLIETSFGNLEIVARIGDRLAHFWRDSATLVWSPPDFVADGIAGTPSFIQGSFGTPGNFELVVPLAAGGLGAFWRNNSDPALPWSGPTSFASGTFNSVSLIQSTFDGDLQAAASGDSGLVLYWREAHAPFDWHGPQTIV